MTVYSALRKSTAQAGDWVVLLGAGGGLGHLATQMASKGMGMRVIGVDAGSKRDLAVECGAEVFIDHTQGKAEEEVMKATGGLGAQAVIVLTAANAAYARYVLLRQLCLSPSLFLSCFSLSGPSFLEDFCGSGQRKGARERKKKREGVKPKRGTPTANDPPC